jgi:large subunit ribosomal protein L10
MPKTKQQKEKIVEGLTDRFSRMEGTVLVDFQGTTMHELEALRTMCRAENCEYVVAKKSLLKIACADHAAKVDEVAGMGGVSALFGFSDPVTPAKIAKQFAKKHKTFLLKGGFLREDTGMRALSAQDVVALGDLPSREELLAKAVGSIASPLRGLVGVLQGNLRNLVGVLSAIREAKV